MTARCSQRQSRASQPTPEDLAAVHVSPLWGLTCVLGDIAARVERRRADEHVEASPEKQSAAGCDPTAREGA